MSGPRSRRTPLDLPAMAASASSSIWPAPGTVRSIMYLGMSSSHRSWSPWVAPGDNLRTEGAAVMRHLPPRGRRADGDSVPPMPDTDSGVRLVELLVALSLATDLGFGQPAE